MDTRPCSIYPAVYSVRRQARRQPYSAMAVTLNLKRVNARWIAGFRNSSYISVGVVTIGYPSQQGDYTLYVYNCLELLAVSGF